MSNSINKCNGSFMNHTISHSSIFIICCLRVQVNIAITSLYLIFGLSLFWMVFHLVQVDKFKAILIIQGSPTHFFQDEVKNKVKNIAIKLGIVKTEEDDYLDWWSNVPEMCNVSYFPMLLLQLSYCRTSWHVNNVPEKSQIKVS